MELNVAIYEKNLIIKQRNLFLLLTILTSVTSCALGLKIWLMEERIIMVPPLTTEVVISNKRVSSAYLEQMTFVFLNSLLDLSAQDIMHKRDIILKYTADSNPKFAAKINEYFAESEAKYKQFDLSTYFTVKNIEVDEANNAVIAHGTLTSRYGKQGFEVSCLSYRLAYEFSGGYLRLKEFSQVIKDG